MCTVLCITGHALGCWGNSAFPPRHPAFSSFLSPPFTKTCCPFSFSLRSCPVLQRLHRAEFLQRADDLGGSSHKNFSFIEQKRQKGTFVHVAGFLLSLPPHSVLLSSLFCFPPSSFYEFASPSFFPRGFWTNPCSTNSLRRVWDFVRGQC